METKSFDTIEKAVKFIKTEYKSEYVDYDEAKKIIDILLDPFLKEESTLSKTFKYETKEDYRNMIAHYSNNIAKLWRLTEKRLELNKQELSSEEIGNIFATYLFGHSKIAPLMSDSKVTDIHILNNDVIFYEKYGINYNYPPDYCFTKEEYNIFLEKRLELAGKSLNAGESKKADFELFGDRYNVKDISISPSSPTIIIRKHEEQKNHRTVNDLIRDKQLSIEMINFLSTCIKGEVSGVIVGVTGSGKTTFFRALFKKFDKKGFCIEDTQELFVKYKFMECLVTSKGYTISDAIQDALRSKSRYILVGEIRDTAATGHSSWTTFHADTMPKLLNRFKLKYIEKLKVGPEEALEMRCDSLDIVIIISNINNTMRRAEIFSCYYDYEKKKAFFKTIFECAIENDIYIFKNGISYDMARLLRFKGITKDEILQYYYPENEREETKKKIENSNTKKKDLSQNIKNSTDFFKINKNNQYDTKKIYYQKISKVQY